MLIRSGVLALLSLLVIILSSPLFAVLGFEYSTIMALALSLVCGIAAAKRQRTEGTAATKVVKAVFFESMLLASIPLVVSVISLIWLNNCSFWDGLVFYLEIAFPSAILG